MTSNSFDTPEPPAPRSDRDRSIESSEPEQTRLFCDCAPQVCDTVPQARDTATGALRDRFELLSAYLDGEVTATERRQIEAWLQSDPQVQSLYSRLLKLRRGMQSLPIPADCSIERTVGQVMSRLEQRRKALVWGGMAIAAMFIGTVSVQLPGVEHATSQIAADSNPAQASSDALMIALDRPVIEIPKAPVSLPMPNENTASTDLPDSP